MDEALKAVKILWMDHHNGEVIVLQLSNYGIVSLTVEDVLRIDEERKLRSEGIG